MVNTLLGDFRVTGLGHEQRPDWFPPGADWYQANLLQPDSLGGLKDGWFAVVHLAGNTVPGAFRDGAAVHQNVEMTRHVLEHVETEKFLLASSALVYAPARTLRQETSPIDPQGPYGRSKQLCEDLARSWRERLEIRIARPFNHIGPNMQPALAIPSIVRRVQEAHRHPGPIEMLGQDSVRDFIDVRDVVAAYRALIELEGGEHTTFNVCTGRPSSIRTVVQAMLDALGVEREIQFAEEAVSADDTSWLVGDPSRLMSMTGWAPEFSLEQSIEDMLTDS